MLIWLIGRIGLIRPMQINNKVIQYIKRGCNLRVASSCFLFIDSCSDFFNAHFRERTFVCIKTFLPQLKNVDIVFERIRINVDEFGVGHSFGKPYRFLLILAVEAVDFSRFGIHRGCNQSVYVIFFANRFKKEFGRSGANHNGSAASVFFFKYRIDILLLFLPEFLCHLFTGNKPQKRKASALEAVAETEKKENQIQQKPRRKKNQIRSVQYAVKQKHRFRIHGINRFVKIVKVKFHLCSNRFLCAVKRNGCFLSVDYNGEIALAFKAVACNFAVFPFDINNNVTFCKQTLDAAVFPL